MEIDITEFVRNEETWNYTGSVATHGPDVGHRTWANALQAPMLLDTEEKRDALRAWAGATGAWDEAERNAWSPEECNALFVQLATQDLRECGLEDCDPDEFDWDEYYTIASKGSIAGNLFRGDDGRVFYYLGE